MRHASLPIFFLLHFCLLAFTGCEEGGSPVSQSTRARSEPIEWVGFSMKWDIADDAAFDAFVEPIFGEQVADGMGHADHELQPGMLLNVFPDTRTPEQVVIAIDMLPSGPPGTTSADRRRIMEVPASFEYGQIFIEAAHAALDKAAEVNGGSPGSMKPFFLQYRVHSDMGGFFELELGHEEGQSFLRLTSRTPETSLVPGEINTPAFADDPSETLAGTVHFSLGRDEFEFFSNRAYGVTAGAAQNFEDFRLLPHDWLRLTVTPRLDEELIDVGFDVITRDGSRVPFAKAPASLVAGEQFQQNVFRMIDNMLAAEAADPGSAPSFVVPFHYDDPEGGGVVRVVFEGDGGAFGVAYAVESPRRYLQDVQYVPYVATIDIPDEIPPTAVTCAELGSTDALSSVLRITFDASSTVRDSANLTDPLDGTFYGSIFKAEDVTLAGPEPGAVAVANLQFDGIDMTMGPSVEFTVGTSIPAGSYQILGFIDIDDNADPMSPDPDEGDPVTLPIGAYDVKCAEQPVTVEFALLLPGTL